MVDYLTLAIKIIIVGGLFLDLVCFKYRSLAHIFIYYENILMLVFYMVPSPYLLMQPAFVIVNVHCIRFAAFWTHGGSQLICHMITLAIIFYFVLPVAYEQGF